MLSLSSKAFVFRTCENVVMVVVLLFFLLLLVITIRSGTPLVGLPPRLVVIIIFPFTGIISWASTTGPIDVHWLWDHLHWIFAPPVVGQNLVGVIEMMINWSATTLRSVLRLHNDDYGFLLFLLIKKVQETSRLNLILTIGWNKLVY